MQPTSTQPGWPVALPAAVPLALHVLFATPHVSLLAKVLTGIVATAVPLAATYAVDAHHYRFPTPTWDAVVAWATRRSHDNPFSHVTPLNLLAYNFLGGSSDLYGVEPATYYLRNAALQLNVLLPLAIFAPVVVALAARSTRVDVAAALAAAAPFPLWFGLLSRIPHKEERFLYVVYPAAHVGGGLALALLPDAAASVLPVAWRGLRRVAKSLVAVAAAVLLLTFAVLSMSRVAALRVHYGASIDVYAHLPPTAAGPVCVHTEWHTFPGSLHLPPAARLAFLRPPGGAKGPLMPLPFEDTWTRGRPFNDRNEEVPEQYLADPAACAYLVVRVADDSDVAEAAADAGVNPVARVLASLPYCNAGATPAWARALFVPRVTEPRIVWDRYVLAELARA